MSREMQLDVRGRACPIPVLELARSIRTLEEGDEVEVRANDPGAFADIQAWCDTTGHTLLHLSRQASLEGVQVLARVRKSSSTPVASP